MISYIDNISSELVYKTPNTSLSQCDKSEQFIVRIFDQEIALNLCSLISFKKKIKDINLPAMFENSHSGIEIISLRQCDRFFVFDIREILELKDLFSGSFAMLELNSMIHKSIKRR